MTLFFNLKKMIKINTNSIYIISNYYDSNRSHILYYSNSQEKKYNVRTNIITNQNIRLFMTSFRLLKF